ncbi:hypothetical protein CCACVL1_30979 [Corchorus capsularis]|uniref:Uncharacterized protein n=1 Tax=Corchorus capsularis TaxID=210143 RepID=A0A1R3FUJ8_COCAP|nr:hypothetical protein CCACVL1_30979 [Corchorus capsularis]
MANESDLAGSTKEGLVSIANA